MTVITKRGQALVEMENKKVTTKAENELMRKEECKSNIQRYKFILKEGKIEQEAYVKNQKVIQITIRENNYNPKTYEKGDFKFENGLVEFIENLYQNDKQQCDLFLRVIGSNLKKMNQYLDTLEEKCGMYFDISLGDHLTVKETAAVKNGEICSIIYYELSDGTSYSKSKKDGSLRDEDIRYFLNILYQQNTKLYKILLRRVNEEFLEKYFEIFYIPRKC